jgi:hypothetical protein
MPPARARFPHAASSVVQMLRLQVAEEPEERHEVCRSWTTAPMGWDNLQSLNDRIGVVAGRRQWGCRPVRS